jgi:hypothetical protein
MRHGRAFLPCLKRFATGQSVRAPSSQDAACVSPEDLRTEITTDGLMEVRGAPLLPGMHRVIQAGNAPSPNGNRQDHPEGHNDEAEVEPSTVA